MKRTALIAAFLAAVAADVDTYIDKTVDKPLVAMLVGGETNPFIMNRKVAHELVATACEADPVVARHKPSGIVKEIVLQQNKVFCHAGNARHMYP